MQKAQVTKTVASALKTYGYNYKSGKFSKTSGNIIGIIEFQKNDHGHGIFTNVGVGPHGVNYSEPPENASHCGLQIRAVHLPLKGGTALLKRLEGGKSTTEEELLEAVRELADWIEGHLMNAESLRMWIRDERSTIRKYGLIMRALKVWAGIDEDA